MMKRFFGLIIFLSLFTNLLNAQGLINGNFDLGPSSGWTKYSAGGFGLIATSEFFNSTEITPQVFPRSGQYMARIGGFAYEVNSISQTVKLPNTTPIKLGMYYQDRASTTSECGGLWVGSRIRVIIAGQTLLDEYICYYNTVNDWTYVYFDLSAAAGQTVTVEFKAEAANSVWSFLYLDDITLTPSSVSVPQENKLSEFQLNQNYPNPFSSSTNITYSLPHEGFVKLNVYNVLGELVCKLVNNFESPGEHQVNFDGYKLSGGAYYYSMEVSGQNGELLYKNTKKLMVTD